MVKLLNRNIDKKKCLIIIMMVVILINSFPSTTHAHRAFFFQVLIDEGQKMYTSSIIKDTSVLESKKPEAKLWNYDGAGISWNYETFEESTDGKSSMPFTFPPKAIKWGGVLKSRNNATGKDSNRAYEIADTLIPNLNELMMLRNGGQGYGSMEDFIKASEGLAGEISSGSTYTYPNNVSVSYGKYFATVTSGGKSFEYTIKMEKGYKSSTFEDGKSSNLYDGTLGPKYSDDIGAISIADIILQGNYLYEVKGHTAADAAEYSNPGTLEIKMSEFLGSTIASLRSLLGLKDIDELVYNEGIVGSSMYYGGIMPQSWMDNALKFHMLFQAMTWLALSLAVIKLLFQRNLATINPSSRISLMEGVKDLILAGFMLIAVFLIINLGININQKIVSVFAATIPDYSAWTGGSLDFASFAGVLMQLYYLIITIYLNVIYTIRAISTAILIASAPFFIASIAFQSKNKSLFETWSRELLANIFMQTFHAFILSFLLSVQMTSVRGIELAVVSFALLPMTTFFRSLITGTSGGLGDKLGITGMSLGANAVGGVASMAGGLLGKGKGKSSHKDGSSDRGSNSDIKTKNSDSLGKNPTNKTTDNALEKQESSFSAGGTEQMEQNREKLIGNTESNSSTNLGSNDGSLWKQDKEVESSNVVMGESGGASWKQNEGIEGPETVKEKNPSLEKSRKPFKNTESFNKDDIGTAFKTVGSMGKDIAIGGAKMTAGAAVAMALGGLGGGAGSAGTNLMTSGASDIGSAAKLGGITAGQFAKKGANAGHSVLAEKFPEIFSKGGNILGAEELNNGDIAVHRDRKMLEDIGMNDIKRTEEKDIAITYNKDNLSDEHNGYLAHIEKAYEDNDMDYLKERGISAVNKTENGNTVVHYNEHGQNQLGYKDVYKNKNKIVETKSPGQPLESQIIYDINNITPRPKDANDNRRGNSSGPTDSGQSEYTQPGDNIGMEDII